VTKRFKTVQVEVDNCKVCGKTMAHEFYNLIGVKQAACTVGICCDCQNAEMTSDKKREANRIKGGTITEVRASTAPWGSGQVVGLVIRKGKTTYTISGHEAWSVECRETNRKVSK
jgi:hypothetical protein